MRETLPGGIGTVSVVEWISATSLHPILASFGDVDRPNLIGPVPRAGQARVPQRPDGITLYLRLRRFFVAAPTRYRPHCSVY